MNAAGWIAIVVAIIAPIIAGLVLDSIRRRGVRIETSNYETHVVLRELVRAVRELGARPDLPRGW